MLPLDAAVQLMVAAAVFAIHLADCLCFDATRVVRRLRCTAASETDDTKRRRHTVELAAEPLMSVVRRDAAAAAVAVVDARCHGNFAAVAVLRPCGLGGDDMLVV